VIYCHYTSFSNSNLISCLRAMLRLTPHPAGVSVLLLDGRAQLVLPGAVDELAFSTPTTAILIQANVLPFLR